MADKEQPATDTERADDATTGRREGNPLEREISFVSQRATVLRPSRADYLPRRSRAAQDTTEDGAGQSQPHTFRQQRMSEYHERRRAHEADTRDDSKRDG